MTLTTDQRWLLLHMGTWAIVWALCSPEGTAHLMQSCWSSTTGRAADMPGAPEWLRHCGFKTEGGAIRAKHVVVTATQINRYAASLPADVKAELIACRDAGIANSRERHRHCYCGNPKREHFKRDVICDPTDEQERAARAEYDRVHAWEPLILAKALRLNDNAEQLDLFGALA